MIAAPRGTRTARGTYASPVPLVIVVRRFGYRVAYRLLRLLWLFTRPRKQGVKCVITDGDRVLLVRHTYGSRAWDLPGGAARRGEPPLQTASREMEEELGLVAVPWRALGELRGGGVHHRRDVIHILGAELSEPVLRIDLGELQVAAWFDRDRLPLYAGPFLHPILDGAGPYVFGCGH